ERFDHSPTFALSVVVRGVERRGMVGTRGLQSVENVLEIELQVLGQLGHGGRAVETAAEKLLSLLDLDRALLGAARHMDRPAQIAEVALELSEDRRDRERGEGRAAREVIAVDRLDQAEARHLQEVIEGLASSAVAAGQLAGEGEEALDELIAGLAIAVLLPAHEKDFVADVTEHAGALERALLLWGGTGGSAHGGVAITPFARNSIEPGRFSRFSVFLLTVIRPWSSIMRPWP